MRSGAGQLLTAAYVLTGLRTTQAVAARLFQGVTAMKESSTFQAILAEEARKIILRQGRLRFGSISPAVEAALQGITDVERLERMSERLLTASTWQDVLSTP
jgi:Domain of unknown function (DUF4351)